MNKFNWKVSLFDLFGYQSVLNVHIIVSGDFQRKSAKKRPLIFETVGTNTGLNMHNGPAVGRRLGLNDFYNPDSFLNELREGGVSYDLLRVHSTKVIDATQ